jgi:ABC-2 type transport system ATP-binding protein
MEEVEAICRRVAVIDQGKLLAEGTLEELLGESRQNLEHLFLQLTGRRLRD